MNKVKIIRLKSGEDIIAFIETGKLEHTLKLVNPLTVLTVFNKKKMVQEILLNYWLPVSILRENNALIPLSEILTLVEPNEKFLEYYLNFLNDDPESNDDETEGNENKGRIKEILDSIDIKGNNKLH